MLQWLDISQPPIRVVNPARCNIHPIAIHSRKMNKHEINYEIHDKELLALTSAFKEWRRNLEGARHKIVVYLDHRGLEWFTHNKLLNRRQPRWALELDRFDFQIIYL